ncbi:glycosyltransferase family 4 protein [Aggregatilinea lenta]|uniref:glycosyltransferase family 4 protein n=1 Tax=Aggregatilinea lenta TaxID=913108 RepID=UPI0013C2CDFB|nr:glycosyltransferase family 4 protein [Aggregatilinea lenta]
MSKPRVLMITPYLPFPPTSGGRSRTYNLVSHLRYDYDITLVCFGRPEETAHDLSPLRALCDLIVVDRARSPGTIKAVWLSLTSLKPVTMRLYHTSEMERTIRRVLDEQRIDLIHVESFYMLANLPQELAVPVLLSEPAIEFVAWRRHAQVATPWFTRPGIALESVKMRLWEPRAWADATVVGVMSPVDAASVKKATPGVMTVLAPNGVDTEYFRPDPGLPRDSQTAVYMGDYKYFPNVDAVLYFAQTILPLIRAERPDFELVLLGKDAPPEIRVLADDPASGVALVGLVDDTRPYLQGSALFVCPLRSGSGTRFKLLEALACGCPVVTTPVGCEGLGATDGKHMLIRESPQAFADAVLSILNNSGLGQDIGEHGREWVVRHHAWRHSASVLRMAYEQLIGHEDPTPHMNKRARAEAHAELQRRLGETHGGERRP